MQIARRAVLFTVLGVTVAACALGIYSLQLKRRADFLVDVSFNLSGRVNPPSVDEVRQQLGSSLRQPDPCTQDGCGYEVMLSNRLLAALHLAPYTALRSTFWAKNGIMQSNDLVFWKLPYVVDVEIKYCSRCALFSVNPGTESSRSVATGELTIDNGATAATKHIVLGIDTGCLTKLAGCSSIAELLPGAWRRSPDDRLHCRIPNRGGIFETADTQ